MALAAFGFVRGEGIMNCLLTPSYRAVAGKLCLPVKLWEGAFQQRHRTGFSDSDHDTPGLT